MKLLLNNKEIAHYLISLMDVKKFIEHVEFLETETAEAIFWWFEKKKEHGRTFNENKWKNKLKQKIRKAVESDLSTYVRNYSKKLEIARKFFYDSIHGNIEYIIEKLGEDEILKNYKDSSKKNFVKSTGMSISPNSTLIRRKNFLNYQEDCLIRNTVGNEQLLISKIDQKYPFWFIDSGYTNFLEPNKKWHRLVRNHLHTGQYFDCPPDRLKNFKCFPKPWRFHGDTILIIEPGPFAAGIFHVEIETWKKNIEIELRKYTNKKIEYREKAPKNERDSLFDLLSQDKWYCVININSNAATEAIWQGIPVITLDQHITNPVTKSQLSDVNSLYRGPLGNWLCMLSYSQFTYDELINGDAAKIYYKYHANT